MCKFACEGNAGTDFTPFNSTYLTYVCISFYRQIQLSHLTTQTYLTDSFTE